VHLFVVTDWDEGFALAPAAEALADVPSDGEYAVECVAPHFGVLQDVMVRGFALDRLYIDDRFVPVVEAPVTTTAHSEDHHYDLTPPIKIEGHAVRAVLRNTSDAPKKPKVAVLAQGLQAAEGWRVEVHTGSAARPLTPSCPTCDSPERDVRRQLTCAHQKPCPHRGPQYTPDEAARIAKETGHYPPNTAWEIVTGKAAASGVFCADTWHDAATKPARESVVHAPKLSRTTHEGPGNATLVRGCSCGVEASTPEAFAAHVGVPERVFTAMLGLVGVIYDLCDSAQVTREEAARRVARCLEFPSC